VRVETGYAWKMQRRNFLLGSLVTVYAAACGSDSLSSGTDGGKPPVNKDGGVIFGDASGPVTPTSTPEVSDAWFPQGLASGDPKPDRVVLWSRIDALAAARLVTDDLDLEFIVATDEALTEIVARGTVPAKADADHTVRVIPTGLEPGRFYYYRFESAGKTTRVARTKTAPANDADVPVKLAFCACQDFIGRQWHSWRALLDEKADFDFILFLGDYIYETVNDARFQTESPDRKISLPDGLDTSEAQDGSRIAAGTLRDYRALYKAYRKDPILKEVHRLYPMIVVWDDHEFSDDCWQDHSTSFNDNPPAGSNIPPDERNTPRRVAANRAFFEFQPVDIFYEPAAEFPNEIKIYRQLRYGKHVELFLTDQRMYRAEHLIPEGPTDTLIGKTTANTIVGSRYLVRKAEFDRREAIAKPSLLGATQKAWFVDAVKKSDATWKVWGNEVQMWEMALKMSTLQGIPSIFTYTVYINADQWDGYRSEREEIMRAFTRAKVDNLLVLTGDIHAFFASEIHVDFTTPTVKPAAVEYVTAGISSASLKALLDKFVPVGSYLRFIVEAWAARADDSLKESNPHLRFSNSNAYGFSMVTIDSAKTEVTFAEVDDPLKPMYTGVLRRRKFITRVGTNKIENA
jgi:alkaline phosphatase D